MPAAAFYAWLNTTPGAVALSRSFGTCSELYKVSWDSETVTVTMPSMQPGEGDIAYVFDGQRIKRGEAGPAAIGPSAGRRSRGVDRRASLRSGEFGRLGAGADRTSRREALAEVRDAMQLSDGFSRQGDWVAGSGTNKYTLARAAVALAADGRLLVAWRPDGGPPRLWGDASRGMPPAVAEVMAGR